MQPYLPPAEAVGKWLKPNDTEPGPYGHLLEQQAQTDDELIAAMRPYFENAHLEPADIFTRRSANLHPDSTPRRRRLLSQLPAREHAAQAPVALADLSVR
jgi:hypothetical protein